MNRRCRWLFVVALLSACDPIIDYAGDGGPRDAGSDARDSGSDTGSDVVDAAIDAGCSADFCDADGDGHESAETGGDDCDDFDANRHPGATEICDSGGHDEDCESSTFGDVDADSDTFLAAECCNASATGELSCGADCDDTDPSVHPGATEVCNGRDNDCDGMIDPGC